jgi:hypothetical protein
MTSHAHRVALILAAAVCLLWASAPARAVTLTFEDLAEGAILSNQYAALGVVFSPNAFTGSNSNSTPDPWATNTGMSITADDVSVLGGPLLTSGKLLHSFSDFLFENGDPSIRASFALPMSSVSIDFVGIDAGLASDVSLRAYDGTRLIGTVVATACAVSCQQTLSFTAASITQVVFTPGSAADWVGVDNFRFASAVPEAGSGVLLALGLSVLLLRRRALMHR